MGCWWFLKNFLGNLQVRIFGKEIKKAMGFFHGL